MYNFLFSYKRTMSEQSSNVISSLVNFEQEILTKQLYDEMVEYFLDEQHSKNTINTYRRFFKDFYDFMKNEEGQVPFCKDGLMRYRRYINLEKPESVKNLNASAIRSFIKFLNQKELLKKIKQEDLRAFQKATRKNNRDMIDEKVVNELLNKCQDDREKLLLQILFFTGARKESVRVLTKRKFTKELDCNYTINFNENVKRVKNYTATVPTTPIIEKFLQKDKPEYLFHSRRNKDKPMCSSAFHDFLDRIVNRLEWDEKPSFHCFRHGTANNLIEKGVDVFTVSKVLNHSSLSSTQQYLRQQKMDLNEIYKDLNVMEL